MVGRCVTIAVQDERGLLPTCPTFMSSQVGANAVPSSVKRTVVSNSPAFLGLSSSVRNISLVLTVRLTRASTAT